MTRRYGHLGAAAWCGWQFGVMLLHLQLWRAVCHVLCIARCLWWAVRGDVRGAGKEKEA